MYNPQRHCTTCSTGDDTPSGSSHTTTVNVASGSMLQPLTSASNGPSLEAKGQPTITVRDVNTVLHIMHTLYFSATVL